MDDVKRTLSEPHYRKPKELRSKENSDTQEAILYFRFDSFGCCTLATTWEFPLTRATATVGVFSAKAFEVSGGKTVRVDLAYALENEFQDLHEYDVSRGNKIGKGAFQASEDSVVFCVTKLRSSKQLHLANGLFIEAATALAELWKGDEPLGISPSPGGGGPPPMSYATHGGLRESRDYRELVQEISSGLSDCELRTLARIANGKSVSQISKEDGVSRAAVRGRVLSAIRHSEYWEISSRLGVLKQRINQHT
jgi:hypothetical protein